MVKKTQNEIASQAMHANTSLILSSYRMHKRATETHQATLTAIWTVTAHAYLLLAA